MSVDSASWSNEEWAAYRDYADRVVVSLKLADETASPKPSEEWLIFCEGAAWPREWLSREVESIALDGRRRGQDGPADYIIEIRERRHSWGAAAAFLHIAMTIAAWAATSAAWDVTKYLAQTMLSKLREGDSPTAEGNDVSDQEAVGRATWIVEERYKEQDLQLKSVELESSGAVVELEGPAWTYIVTIGVQDELLVCAKVKRSRR